MPSLNPKVILMSEPVEPPAASADRTGGTQVTLALDEAECLRLVAQHEVGRIAYAGRFGPTVLPVNYRLFEGSIVFRTGMDSPLDEDLQTGIANAEYKVAFEIDDLDPVTHEGWSVLIQGPVHHVTAPEERAAVAKAGVNPWAGGPKERYLRVMPTRITGRRITHPGGTG